MKLRKEILVLLLSAGTLILQGCGNNTPEFKALLEDKKVGSNANGVNEIDISTDQQDQTCSINVIGERDDTYPSWGIVHTKWIVNRDKIKWVATDKTPTKYQIVFTQGSPTSDRLDPVTPSQPLTVSINAGEGIACVAGCEDPYDIQVADQSGNMHSCLPKSGPRNYVRGIGVIVKP